MSPCDIPLRVRIFLMLSPSLLLINIIITYEILHFQTILYYNSSMIAAKQNQKFPFHFFFRFAAEGWGEEAREKCKEIFWFLHTRVRERVRGAFSLNQDLTQNTFELCPINTANFRKGFLNQKYGRREAPSVLHSPHKILILQGFATLRVAPRLPIQL